jgi:hypothetical protein
VEAEGDSSRGPAPRSFEKGTPATTGGRLSKELRDLSHDVPDILGRTGLTWTPEDLDLAERMESFVRWAGRYPIAGSVQDMRPKPARTGGSAPLYIFKSTDPDTFAAMVAKLEGA